MDKPNFESPDLTQANIEKLKALFPSVVTESENGKKKNVVNFEALRQLLSSEILEGDEAYEFTWVGKKAAIVEAARPVRKTLRPCKKESKNWDTTENLYIEGDNLDVLKLLQENYLGKVKMIYIDPPYNTGKDKLYPDNFKIDKDAYQLETGEVQIDENDEKRRFFINKAVNGRFHSDWCSIMYPRLMLARNLLSEDGVIFISCDDNEQENIKKMCNEIFGEDNFVTQLVWEKKKKGSFLSDEAVNIKEYIIIYSKNHSKFEGLIGEVKTAPETYPCINANNKREIRIIPKGIKSNYKEKNYFLPSGSEISDNTMTLKLHSNLIIKDGILDSDLKIEGNWRYSQEKMSDYAKNDELYITQDLYIRRIVSETRNKALKDILYRIGEKDDRSYKDKVEIDNLFASGWGSNEDADEELRLLLGVQKLMEYPKPSRLLFKLLASYRNTKDSIILDFFSGSATTAHAVMQLNAEDGSNRKFIMVQIPETCPPNTEAAKAGYKNICEIGKERIRRAGENIKKDNADKEGIENLDTGFRVFKCDDSNMEDVYYNPQDLDQNNLLKQVDNIKKDRSDEDLLFGCILEWGLPLSLKHEKVNMDDRDVHFYDDNALACCFAPNIGESIIKEIAKRKPLRAVFRDSSFADSQSRINAAEFFKSISPDTAIIVL